MSDLFKIERVEPREGFWLRISFSDGAIKDVDVANVLARGDPDVLFGRFEPASGVTLERRTVRAPTTTLA